ncbi:MAG: double zinc ribbon domain-containing protein [Anaerolineae bacterium]|jgi:RNA polymerase subunit RPABC4/transcription elongation factor Spt4
MDFESILAAIQPFVIMIAALLGATVTAIWIAVVIWAFRDIRARTRDVFAQILGTLLVLIFLPFFPLPGLILYMILRPRETLAEVYERSLEEEALLQSIEERMACPGCNRHIEEEFLVCPTCHTRLKKGCPSCGRLLHLRWNICPYCGAVQTATKATATLAPSGAVEAPRIPAGMQATLLEPAMQERVEPEMETQRQAPRVSAPPAAEPSEDIEPVSEPVQEPEAELEPEPEVTPDSEAEPEWEEGIPAEGENEAEEEADSATEPETEAGAEEEPAAEAEQEPPGGTMPLGL